MADKFKFALGQTVYIEKHGTEVVIEGRTEFRSTKQPRYYIAAKQGAIPGKNGHEDWINENLLTATKPVPVPTAEEKAEKKKSKAKAVAQKKA